MKTKTNLLADQGVSQTEFSHVTSFSPSSFFFSSSSSRQKRFPLHQGLNVHSSVSFIDHPSVKLFPRRQLLLLLLCHFAREQHARQGSPSRSLRRPLIALILFVAHLDGEFVLLLGWAEVCIDRRNLQIDRLQPFSLCSLDTSGARSVDSL